MWRALPELRRLVIKGVPRRLGVLALPRLEHLEIHGVQIDLMALRMAACPELTRLELRYRPPQDRDVVERLTPILEILESPLARRLEHLAISELDAMDDLAYAIAKIRKPSLRTLDLSNGSLGDHGAEILAASGLELDIIDVSRNRLSDRGKLELEKIAKLVIAEQQKYPYRV